MVQNLFAVIKAKGRVEQRFDFEAERRRLAQLFDKALRQANIGNWTGGSLKGDNSMVFYFAVNDETKSIDAIDRAFSEYVNRSNFHNPQIRKL